MTEFKPSDTLQSSSEDEGMDLFYKAQSLLDELNNYERNLYNGTYKNKELDAYMWLKHFLKKVKEANVLSEDVINEDSMDLDTSYMTTNDIYENVKSYNHEQDNQIKKLVKKAGVNNAKEVERLQNKVFAFNHYVLNDYNNELRLHFVTPGADDTIKVRDSFFLNPLRKVSLALDEDLCIALDKIH